MLAECSYCWIGLCLTSLAMLISMCLNVIFCFLRRRDYRSNRAVDTDELLCPHPYQRERVSSPSIFEEDQPQMQENPIYGNINTDGGVQERTFEDICYESMAKLHAREEKKPAEPDLNYASLDLNQAAQKRKKKRRRQPGQNQLQLQATLSQSLSHSQALTQMGGFLEVEAEVEACLPSRSSSQLASHNSIYLNSQQMALETKERERRREEGGRQWEVDRQWEREVEDKNEENSGEIEGEIWMDLEA